VTGSGDVRVVPLEEAGEAAWDGFVASRDDRSHYHRAGWARVIRNAFGQRPLYRAARAGDAVEGVMPVVAFASPVFGRYLVSVPFLNRGGILAATDRARRALLEDAGELVRATRSRHCELRGVAGAAGAGELPARENKVSMSLSLDGGRDEVWKRVGPKVRNLVRKAEKAGLVAREGDPARDLDAFYDVFARNMRELGTPVYSPRFFREICREFPGDVRLSVVEGGSGVAAAAICVTEGGFTEIHWAASRREMLPQAPNMLLYWEAIAHAADRGLREFCMGRSTEGSGPHRFKAQWGARPTRLRWEYVLAEGAALPGLNPDNPRFRLAVRAWQRLPLAVTRWLGPPIVRHLP
jgi:FemAB-related protein (PEP-CTERM system-associated)